MKSFIQDNTQVHTKQYDQYGSLLYGQPVRNEKGDMIGLSFYTPDSAHALYAVTKFMRDDELDFINYERARNGKSKLDRLAHMGDGIFIPVHNHHERKIKELSVFKDAKIPNFDIILKDISKGIINYRGIL